MNAAANLPPSGAGKRVLGSFLSAFAGWSALFLTAYVGYFFESQREAYGFLFYPIVCAPFILVVWLVVLLPLYFCVPARSVLWRWPLCTLCGATAGTLIALVVWCVLDPPGVAGRFTDFFAVSSWLGGVCGGATCLFGSLTAPAFRRRVEFAPALDQTVKGIKRMFAWLKAKFLASSGQ